MSDPNHALGSFRQTTAFTAVILAILICFYLPLLTGQTVYFVSDHTFFYEPFSRFLKAALRQGHLPLWNPYLYCGMAQIAVPAPGIFYPGTWLYAIFSYSQALAWQMVIHQALAGAGTFLLVSSFGWGFAPAAVAALTVAFTGYMFSLTTNFTLVATASSLPLMFWSFRGLAVCHANSRRTAMYWFLFLASCSTCLFIAAGRPDIFVPGIALLFAFNILAGINCYRHGNMLSSTIAVWRWQLLAFLAGTLITMPILLPLLEWFSISPRAHGFALKQMLMWSANWYDFVCMIFPQPFGDLQVLGAPLLPLVATRPVFLPYLTSTFIGPICLTLAIWGLLDEKWTWRNWLTLCLAICLIMCLGEYTAIVPYLVTTFPALAVCRYPIKWLIFPIICLAVAAARGLRNALRAETRQVAILTTTILWGASLLVGVSLILLGSAHIYLTFGALRLSSNAVFLLGEPVVASAVLGLLTNLWLNLLKRGILSRRNASIVLIFGLAANLLLVAVGNRQITADPSFYNKTPVLKNWLEEIEPQTKGRILNLYFDPVHCPSTYRFEPAADWTTSFYAYCRDLLLANTCIDTDTPQTFGYEAAETGAYRKMVRACIRLSKADVEKKDKGSDLPLYRLCQSTATKFIASQIYKGQQQIDKLDSQYFVLKKEDAHLNLRLYQVVAATPRFYFAPCWQWVKGQDEIAKRLLGTSTNQFDPVDLPLIERDSAKPVEKPWNYLAPQIVPPPDLAPAPGDKQLTKRIAIVSILQDQPEHVSLSLATANAGFVILCDHFYPGWQVAVDNVPAMLYRANLEARAAYVPAGEHLIEFDYKPESLANGGKCAAVGLTLLLCFLLRAGAPAVWAFVKATAGQG